MMIYCAHEYGGNPENKRNAEIIIKAMQKQDTANCYVSPIHCFGFLYDDLSYDAGMELCYDLLTVCDKLMVLSGPSEGVLREVRLALALGMEVEYYGTEAIRTKDIMDGRNRYR